jgi:Recombination endonuclease VII
MPALSKLYTKKQIDKIREELIARYGNQCAICEKPREVFKKNLSVDHNHKTNKIRGLLCYRCNKFILGRQTLATVRKMLAYLLKYDPEGC